MKCVGILDRTQGHRSRSAGRSSSCWIDRSYVRHGGFGDQPDALGEPLARERDMILHFPENEWHVFEYEEGGHLTITFFYPALASTPDRWARAETASRSYKL